MDSPLRTFLRGAARKYDNIFSEAAQRDITAQLYTSLWANNDDYLHTYFPYFAEARQKGVIANTDNGDDEYSPSARGQACGHTFKMGEGVFRCRTCALDETCVLCLRCFHGTNHEGHDTSFSVNAGGGGCCDCGDPEAWRVNLDCIYHSAAHGEPHEERQEQEYPPEVSRSIRETIAAILDFVIDTVTVAPEDNTGTWRRGSQLLTERDIQQAAIDAGNIAGEDTDLDTMMYACILWNEEEHSFIDVIDRLSDITNMSSHRARACAERVHTHGREIIEISSSIPHLLEVARGLAHIGLVVSIRSARETFKEQICDVCVSFLKMLAYTKGGVVSQKQSATIREIICDELCSEWRRRPARRNTTMNQQDTIAEMEEDYIDIDGLNPDDVSQLPTIPMDEDDSSANTSLREDHFLDTPSALELRHANDEDTLMGDSLTDNASGSDPSQRSARAGPPHRKLRIDWLLLLDLKFWKMPRSSLKEVYIGTLVLDPKYKRFMAVRFAFNYNKIARAFLEVDREPELSIILFSVQLFTVPTIAEMLAREHNFMSILCQILINFFVGPNYTGGPIDCTTAPFENRRYFHIFHDLRYILSNEAVRQIIASRPTHQAQMIETLHLFQGMHPNTRCSTDHIEFESNTWVNAFNVTLQLYKCCRQFADCFSSNPRVMSQALHQTLKKLHEWCSKHEEENAPSQERPPSTVTGDAITNAATPGVLIDNGTMPGALPTNPPSNPTASSASTQARPAQAMIQFTPVHTVVMPSTPPSHFEVIQYKVSGQPVAFHHPLHWFLADLLENVDLLDDSVVQQLGYASFRDMMLRFVGSDKETDDKRLFKLQEIFDYPLRVCVLMAQIKANVWVRNGFVIRTQAQYYREVSLRENTYDSDIYLLQLAFVLFDPEHFLVTMLDRFELLQWFSGQREHRTYDLLQIVFMAEELLTLLIVCVTDPVNPAGFTVEQEIRREIVHGLCLKPIAYSELTKRIPERLTEHAKFDDILRELASYRPPDGITDHGLYGLRDQYFDEVDPYFIHFSRNNSEEAEEILKTRAAKKRGDQTAKPPLILPRLTKIDKGPFSSLGNMMHTRAMTQVLFYTFWNVKAEPKIKSDTIIDQAAYLMQIATLDPNSDPSKSLATDAAGESTGVGMTGFVHHATFDKYPVIINGNERVRYCLLQILIQRADDPAYKSVHPKLHFVISKFGEIGSTEAKRMVGEWKASKGPTAGDDESNDEMAEAARRKQAALERQKKIMEQFAQAQKSFMSQNEDLYDDEDDDFESMHDDDEQVPVDGSSTVTETMWHYPTGTCIVCQEEMNQSSVYGMLAFVQPSHLLRQTPMDDPQFLLESVVSPLSLDVSATSIRPFGIASNFEKHKSQFEAPSSENTPPQAQDDQAHSSDPASPHPTRTSAAGHGTPPKGHGGPMYQPQKVARGFPASSHRRGLYSSSCGHLMHVKCFETYIVSLEQRHASQHSRNYPENPEEREFMCPLCKSLGNLLLPITWKGKKQTYPGKLVPTESVSIGQWMQAGPAQAQDELLANKRRWQDQPEPSSRVDAPSSSFLGGYGDLPGVFHRRPLGAAGATSRTIGTFFSMGMRNAGGWGHGPVRAGLMRGGANAAGGEPSSYLSSSVPTGLPADANEPGTIKKMYFRLAEVFQKNRMNLLRREETLQFSESEVNQADVMWDAFAYTISCVEITQRGVNSANGTSTLIAGIQQQTLTLLHVMADTILSYLAAVVNRPMHEMRMIELAWERLGKIFIGHPKLTATRELDARYAQPLLLSDPFFVLTELAFLSVPAGLQPCHLLEVLTMAEVVKTVAAFVTVDITRLFNNEPRMMAYAEHSLSELSADDSANLRQFVQHIMTSLGLPLAQQESFFDRTPARLVLKLLRTYVLPFLRKAALLFEVRYSVIFPETQPAMTTAEPDEDEYTRLANLLHVDNLLPMCAKWMADEELQAMIQRWCADVVDRPPQVSLRVTQVGDTAGIHGPNSVAELATVMFGAAGSSGSSLNSMSSVGSGASSSASAAAATGSGSGSGSGAGSAGRLYPLIGLNHPTIYELVGLPRRLDALFEQSIKFICPECKTVPADPALCLCCGTIVCCQSFCCLDGLDEDSRGECNIHAATCTGAIGVYLLIKKCVILLLHARNGCFHPAPFLDEHGEADLGLRRGRPQFLNPLRYDDLRRLWLTHGIPIHVARKIEQSYDVGGWRTL
ncbi:hypothetical protein DFQ27_002579 [Actinomortierella ambigua]|uniref:E3 ubiquitin-protein ligase n=1 Tax=Actinomortierella ambigua TaxID=1343610 RepID=A0A9P6QBI0_9FUNG|nr:hypothetical protein DFQ27_002579 [Actinomortierella ambigua]